MSPSESGIALPSLAFLTVPTYPKSSTLSLGLKELRAYVVIASSPILIFLKALLILITR